MSSDEQNNSFPGSVDIIEQRAQGKAVVEVSKAVALEYDRSIEEAPRVIATGRGAIAEQILNLAFAHGVKVREDSELVDILEKVDVESPIPLEAFAAVAEILAYVYKANHRIKDPIN